MEKTGIGGQPVWCLNKNLSIGTDGWEIKASDFGLEWISHLAEPTNGGEIADETLAAKVEGELTTAYFDAMGHLLAGTLEKKAAEDDQLKMVVSELFGHDECLSFESEKEEINILPLSPEMEIATEDTLTEKVRSFELNRDNFLSQFYLASMGVVMANYKEVSYATFACCVHLL